MEKNLQVLGVKLNPYGIKEVADFIEQWISAYKQGPAKYICVTNVNSVVEAQKNPYLKEITNASDLSVCDGMPLVWAARRNNFKLKERVYGFALMNEILKISLSKGYKNYFYGSTPYVIDKMVINVRSKYPGLKICGSYSPPFRNLTAKEKEEVIRNINNSKADIVWVGLGYPKQEIWMYEYRDSIKCPVFIGVGAAFDFFAGNKRQAPVWIQNAGLEWFFRLLCEPKRLWRRYLVNNTIFIFLMLKKALKFNINLFQKAE
ncbi:MAG: WecB/TagA/CpsF family glycosyltransferase [Candidatus Omnitrophota bacterium]